MPTYKSSEPTSRPDFVPAGDYTVEILNAEESVSKQGNDLIELKLRIEPSGATTHHTPPSACPCTSPAAASSR